MTKQMKSRFTGFLASAVAVTMAVGAVLAVAQSALQYAIVQDQYGSIIGQVAGNGLAITCTTGMTCVTISTYTGPPPAGTMSNLAPAFTPTPTTVTVTVPTSSMPMVAFCVSGNYYDKKTGYCADGKFPYKEVPAGSLSNPAAQTPNVACTAPKVPTFSSSTSKWSCLVPVGYKVTM